MHSFHLKLLHLKIRCYLAIIGVALVATVLAVFCYQERSSVLSKLTDAASSYLSLDIAKCSNATIQLLVSLLKPLQSLKRPAIIDHGELAMREAVNYEPEARDLKQVGTSRAEVFLNTLKFSEYEENNFCDLMQGLPLEEYDDAIDEIAMLTNMPYSVRERIKRSKVLKDGSLTAVDKKNFITKDGVMVFGRIAVIHRNEAIDIVYSLHSLKYKLKETQENPENAKKMGGFFSSMKEEEKEKNTEITFQLRNDLEAFFEREAIKKFVKKCKYVLKTLKNDAIMEQLGVEREGEEFKEKA
ncbi:uncharacterized protein LOC116619493 [Nematostella vectensis]|uniref:uncharacterized protein LOC116619493 n=1 Tax=Nematostella vectensis TaxID=45351 RepID=UPI0020776359|nr:uncharacterized protein LOC116619493 [Nematostella vectensis]